MAVTLQNERQYEFTKAQLKKLEAACKEAKDRLDKSEGADESSEIAQLNSIAFLQEDLRGQIADYEKQRARSQQK